MNYNFVQYSNKISSDSLKIEAVNYQKDWVLHRRRQAFILANGGHGHSLGIYALSSMIASTKFRNKELEFLLNFH